MKVTLIEHTPNPEQTIALAAKMCYSDSTIDNVKNNLTEEKTEEFIKMLSDIGHESPIEHISFTFGLEGVSRTLLAQITRHRIASFSVQSQRYVKNRNKDSYIIPPLIEENAYTKEIFEKSMKESFDAYNKISELLTENYIAKGFNKNVAEKKAIEDARFVLPNACETKMVFTMNARSLKNFFRLRCCNRAQWEIKAVADEMLKLVKEVAPTLFKDAGAPCVNGKCPEGKMSCGNPPKSKA